MARRSRSAAAITYRRYRIGGHVLMWLALAPITGLVYGIAAADTAMSMLMAGMSIGCFCCGLLWRLMAAPYAPTDEGLDSGEADYHQGPAGLR